jgi:transposase
VIALEDLKSAGMKKKNNGRRFNHKLGSWLPYQLEQFIEYKLEEMGKTVIYVNPKFTSQKCSKCGYIHKNNRKGNIFHCLNCNFELHADLNAAGNIEVLGKSENFRLLSTSQSLRFDEFMPTGIREISSKSLPSERVVDSLTSNFNGKTF